MRNKAYWLVAGFSILLMGAAPGEKRTILTSGHKVHTIRYQLGQSTIVYFGLRPDTVICGNKNYFNIEKIAQGITIQPLSGISTNLAVLTQGKRFLFFLTPAKGARSDAFIDVRWVPENESRPALSVGAKLQETVRALGQKLRFGELEVRLKREIRIETANRTILEFEVRNTGRSQVKTSDIAVLAIKASRPLNRQVSIFEQDTLKSGALGAGRLIVTGADLKGMALAFSYLGQSGQIEMPRRSH